MADDTNGLTPGDKEIWQAAFLAVLPAAIEAQGWKHGDKAITSGEARVNLAALWADYAVLESRARFDAQASA
ncbi:hypothetical protein [Achromobacter denitrificans]|uniref:hypothetical protein n=1 Tax=Achromobacter denitrificans TaxID=32002 RepID=UPI000B4939B6|nr:hypothetical protein [Achromobacter denitrificans]